MDGELEWLDDRSIAKNGRVSKLQAPRHFFMESMFNDAEID
jgi:hypothetical protein